MDDNLAREFFSLLDADGSGTIDADELVRGCVRLRGTSRQVDLCLFTLKHTQDILHSGTIVPPRSAKNSKKCPSTHQMCALRAHFWSVDGHYF